MKKYGWLLGGILLLIGIGAVVHDFRTSSFELTGVSDALQAEEKIYVIDNNGDSYHLFRICQDGIITGRIDLPKLEETWWNAYSSLCVDTDGTIYVYHYGKSMNSSERRSLVYRCDFDKGVLEEYCVLPSEQMFRIQVMDEAVYYTASAGDESTGFYRKIPGQEEECLLLVERKSQEIKSFFYKEGQGFLWLDWNGMFFLNHTGISGEGDYVNFCVGAGGIVFTDMEQRQVVQKGWEIQGDKVLYDMDDIRLISQDLEYQDVLPLHNEADGSMSAGIEISGERRILGLFDGKGRQINQIGTLRNSGLLRLKTGIIYICRGIAWMMVFGLLIKAGLWYTKGIIPIVAKLLCVLVPVVVISGMILQEKMEKSLEARMMKMDYDLLYNVADERLSMMNPAELTCIDLQNVPEDFFYQKIFKSQDYSVLKKEIYSEKGSVCEPIIANTYQWLFMLGEGELRYAEVNGLHYYGSRVAYDRNRQEMEKMMQAMEQQYIVKTEYNDYSGDFVALYVPVIDQHGESVGIMESGFNRRILVYEIHQQMNQIHWMLTGLTVVLVGTLAAVLGCFLYPLGKVKDAVEEVSRGNLGRVVKVGGKDEVAGIAAAFNHMSLRLKEQVDFIQKCSDGYAAFVPEKVFEILGRENITQVRLGDQKEIPAAVLQIGSRQFRDMAKSMTGSELYGMMNEVLKEMIPIVTGEEGIVDHMSVDGLTAYYPEGTQRALITAVSICEKTNWLRRRRAEIPVYRITIHYGTIRVGIVGQEKRMEASTISEVLTLAEFLQEMAQQYDARILMMESAAEEVNKFKERFHSRMIGYLYIRMTKRLEAVYEVYDGEEEAQRQLKEETRELFQEAVSDYLSEEYYEARLKFARILRSNPRDLVAREYVYRCDEYYQDKEKGKLKVWLEEY